jgi:hypothetical protein
VPFTEWDIIGKNLGRRPWKWIPEAGVRQWWDVAALPHRVAALADPAAALADPVAALAVKPVVLEAARRRHDANCRHLSRSWICSRRGCIWNSMPSNE